MSQKEFRDSSLLLVWNTVHCHDYHQRISRLELAAGLCRGPIAGVKIRGHPTGRFSKLASKTWCVVH
jgi:hypothetical protein